ncbi:uncharacterized protein LOC122459857 [Dermochelys coriacea]|uniref:uncharacterized protein LOC122459857 n=1 Tax=Dermochelys coriacea TaxID=27794 RepID=UPI001CA88636|nr:uncharacterized protein LOC122459857 [Dermochelys coriacea]
MASVNPSTERAGCCLADHPGDVSLEPVYLHSTKLPAGLSPAQPPPPEGASNIPAPLERATARPRREPAGLTQTPIGHLNRPLHPAHRQLAPARHAERGRRTRPPAPRPDSPPSRCGQARCRQKSGAEVAGSGPLAHTGRRRQQHPFSPALFVCRGRRHVTLSPLGREPAAARRLRAGASPAVAAAPGGEGGGLASVTAESALPQNVPRSLLHMLARRTGPQRACAQRPHMPTGDVKLLPSPFASLGLLSLAEVTPAARRGGAGRRDGAASTQQLTGARPDGTAEFLLRQITTDTTY